MKRLPLLNSALCLLVVGSVSAAAPTVEQLQGLYVDGKKEAAGQEETQARVVALGKGAFKVFLRRPQGEGKVGKVELVGKIDGDVLRLAGKAGEKWTGTCADGVLALDGGTEGKLELKRVMRASPTLGARPPKGAVVLLGAGDDGELTQRSGLVREPAEGGALRIPQGGMNSKTQIAGSFRLHVEFKVPLQPEARDQGRGNSGVYLPNGDEVQVLDSFGMTTYKGGGCGGLYAYRDPDVFDQFSLASLPPLQWQTYDIEYRVEQKGGKPVGKPRVTVLHNGIKIHDNVELQREAHRGGLHFQDHGNPVWYRNIWVLPLDENERRP